MADYNSMKVPELKKLLNERGLPQNGNKADLIARLSENDKQKAAETAEPQADSSKKPAVDDEIDYEDDDVPATKPAVDEKPAAAAPTEEKAGTAAAPAETTTSKTDTDAAVATNSTTDTKGAGENTNSTSAEGTTAAATTTTAPEQTAKPLFTQNLPPTDAKTEAEKRAARAARFGITAEENKDSEEAKKAARAARFGVANDVVSALDSALPDRAPRKRGRGGAEAGEGGSKDEEGGRANKRPNRGAGGGGRPQQQQQQQQQRGGRNQRGRRHGGGGGGGGGNANAQKGGGKPQPKSAALDPAEKAKLEARAKRFAAAA